MRPKKESSSEAEDAGLKVAAPAGKPGGSAEKKSGAPGADKRVAGGKKAAAQGVGAKIIAAGDKNGDGVLTEDEFQEKDRANFPKVDANGDGKVEAAELEAAIKAASGE